MDAVRSDVDSALARVARDVSATTPDVASGHVGGGEERGWEPTLVWRGTSTAFAGGELPVGSSDAIATVLADQLQYDIEIGLRQPWPKCPSHRHELTPDWEAPGAWVCPSTREVVARIGELNALLLGQWEI